MTEDPHAAPAAAGITAHGRVGDGDARAALRLAQAAAAADGVGPLSEQVRLHLSYGGDPASRNLFLWRDGELAGYAHLGRPEEAGGRSGELVVHPAYRGHGLGLALAHATVAQAGGQPVRLWAHGDLPAAARLAAAAGFTRVRALWRMGRSLRTPLAEPEFPAGVRIRTFVPGRDEAAWLALNNRAFAAHPEQGVWRRDDLDRREREPWFDPAGFFLAESGDGLIGFHWTKVHPPHADSGEPVGEVYVIGVDSPARGSGLGRALTLAGLRHLRDRGVPAVMLYVAESNPGAIHLYRSLGFGHDGTDVMYERTPPAPAGPGDTGAGA